MAISLYSNNVISILNVGNDTVEATALSNMSIKEEIVEGGFSNQKNQYFITGQVESNKKTKIAKIIITAEKGSYFTSKPSIKKNSSPRNLSIKSFVYKRENIKRKIISASGNLRPRIKSYIIYIYYRNSRQVFSRDRLHCNIDYKTKKYISNDPVIDSIVDVDTREYFRLAKTIDKVTYGSSVIPASGDERMIKIHGTPGAKFKIVVNENQIDGYDDFGKYASFGRCNR